MPLSMKETTAISEIANLLYDFLPGSGNSRTSFPLAAHEADVADFWQPGSKLPSLTQLLSNTLEHRRNRFCPLIKAILRQSMTWRQGRNDPLKREEIEHLNKLRLGVSFRIPELTDVEFLSMFPQRNPSVHMDINVQEKPNSKKITELANQLIQLSMLAPQPRGYAFEKFLRDLFETYALAPRASFRLLGEQIDGSFTLDGETYLLEAKWQNRQSGVADLHTFSGKVSTKAKWARGLFISNSGFSVDGLNAFGKSPTSIICMDGFDLHETLTRQIPLGEVLAKKVRRAAETGGTFISVRELF